MGTWYLRRNFKAGERFYLSREWDFRREKDTWRDNKMFQKRMKYIPNNQTLVAGLKECRVNNWFTDVLVTLRTSCTVRSENRGGKWEEQNRLQAQELKFLRAILDDQENRQEQYEKLKLKGVWVEEDATGNEQRSNGGRIDEDR